MNEPPTPNTSAGRPTGTWTTLPEPDESLPWLPSYAPAVTVLFSVEVPVAFPMWLPPMP